MNLTEPDPNRLYMRVLAYLRQRLATYAGTHAWAFMLWNMRRLHQERTELKQVLRSQNRKIEALKQRIGELERDMERPHVDLFKIDPLSSSFQTAKLIRRTRPDDPTIGAQVRSGWATYVQMNEPHIMAECPFDENGRWRVPS